MTKRILVPVAIAFIFSFGFSCEIAQPEPQVIEQGMYQILEEQEKMPLMIIPSHARREVKEQYLYLRDRQNAKKHGNIIPEHMAVIK